MITKEPIRKRGYYRALKSGKQWALAKKAFNGMLEDMANSFYKDIMEPSKLLGLNSWLANEALYYGKITSIKYGKDE